jgi:DNA-binding CsgD family transcriptional regulator
MRKEVLLYGLIMASVLIVLKLLEASFFFQNISIEYYLSIVAITFLILGLWFGNRNKKYKKEVSLAPELMKKKLDKLGISNREYEVICKLSEGLSNKEIAESLYLSENTIKTHLANIFSKLNAKRRTEVLKILRSEGILN